MSAQPILRMLLILAIVTGSVCWVAGQEQEKKVTAAQVPSIIITNFKSAYPHALILGYSSEKEDGKQYYEIESRDGTLHRDVLYNPDGSVAEIEETIATNDLPAAIQESFRRQHPRGVITLAEKTTAGDKVTYEVKAREGRKRFSVEFDADGKVIKGKP